MGEEGDGKGIRVVVDDTADGSGLNAHVVNGDGIILGTANVGRELKPSEIAAKFRMHANTVQEFSEMNPASTEAVVNLFNNAADVLEKEEED